MYGRRKHHSMHLAEKTMPIAASSQQNEEEKDGRRSSFDSFAGTKLPMIRIKKVMKKIGAAQKNNSIYVPPDEDQASFRRSKWLELREQYSTRRGKQEPFEYELDEIVLDCWQYGQDLGRKTIWKKYKQKFDELTFDTLKVVRKKKL